MALGLKVLWSLILGISVSGVFLVSMVEDYCSEMLILSFEVLDWKAFSNLISEISALKTYLSLVCEVIFDLLVFVADQVSICFAVN